MADRVVYNRYRNISEQIQTFMTLDDGIVTIYPQGTAIARADSAVARSRDTVIVQRNVEMPDYTQAEDLDYTEQEETTPEVPQHENQNPTNTQVGLGEPTILTDAFDGSGNRGAVNTAAADLAGTQPETPTPPADMSPKKAARTSK